jgi:hypothetical protein
MYNCKNYRDQGGDRDVIGGELSFAPGALITRKGTDHALLRYLPDAAGTTVAGLKAELNLLLAKLRDAGILEVDVPEITIITQPVDSDPGDAISVEAVVSDSDVLSYQWYQNTTDSNTGGSVVTGATGKSYTVPANLAATAYFYCVITAGNTGVTATTDPCTVRVPANAFATVSKEGGGSVKITYHDAGVEANDYKVSIAYDAATDHAASIAFADGVLSVSMEVASGSPVTLTAAALVALIAADTDVAALFTAEATAAGDLTVPQAGTPDEYEFGGGA